MNVKVGVSNMEVRPTFGPSEYSTADFILRGRRLLAASEQSEADNIVHTDNSLHPTI